jgi:hypothetical protein
LGALCRQIVVLLVAVMLAGCHLLFPFETNQAGDGGEPPPDALARDAAPIDGLTDFTFERLDKNDGHTGAGRHLAQRIHRCLSRVVPV